MPTGFWDSIDGNRRLGTRSGGIHIGFQNSNRPRTPLFAGHIAVMKDLKSKQQNDRRRTNDSRISDEILIV
jgi:hypothetical protein